MESQLVFGEDKSIAMRDRAIGIDIAIRHADRVDPLWSMKAYAKLEEFLEQVGSIEFMAEQARTWAEHRGLEKPPSERAWGAIICKAQGRGIIKSTGYAKTTNPRAHGTPATLWVKN